MENNIQVLDFERVLIILPTGQKWFSLQDLYINILEEFVH